MVGLMVSFIIFQCLIFWGFTFLFPKLINQHYKQTT